MMLKYSIPNKEMLTIWKHVNTMKDIKLPKLSHLHNPYGLRDLRRPRSRRQDYFKTSEH
jgi:hypothetical protein